MIVIFLFKSSNLHSQWEGFQQHCITGWFFLAPANRFQAKITFHFRLRTEELIEFWKATNAGVVDLHCMGSPVSGDEPKNLHFRDLRHVCWHANSALYLEQSTSLLLDIRNHLVSTGCDCLWSILNIWKFEWCLTEIHSGFFFRVFFTVTHLHIFSFRTLRTDWGIPS